jgi:hypothetical protein
LWHCHCLASVWKKKKKCFVRLLAWQGGLGKEELLDLLVLAVLLPVRLSLWVGCEGSVSCVWVASVASPAS